MLNVYYFKDTIPPDNSDKLYKLATPLLNICLICCPLCFPPEHRLEDRCCPVYILNNASVLYLITAVSAYYNCLFSFRLVHFDGGPPCMIWCSTTQLMPFQYNLHGCGPTCSCYVNSSLHLFLCPLISNHVKKK